MSDKSGPGEWVELWLDAEVVETFRAAGPNWKELMHAVLADWLKDHSLDELKLM